MSQARLPLDDAADLDLEDDAAGGLAKGDVTTAAWPAAPAVQPRVNRGGLPHRLRSCTGWLRTADTEKKAVLMVIG